MASNFNQIAFGHESGDKKCEVHQQVHFEAFVGQHFAGDDANTG
jgi:hypothetical protein